MIENRIENFAELESALNEMKLLSEEITGTFGEANQIYDEQKEGWYSITSKQESQKMMDYAEEAKKIAKNIAEVSEAVERFKTATRAADEQK